ncbi:MAG: PD-(D/E)XK nuclease family protein [Halanaerobiales bacterium]
MIKELVLSTKFKPLSEHNLKEFSKFAKGGVSFYALPSANIINQAKKMLLINENSVLIKSNVLSIERLAEMILDQELVWSQISEDQSLALVSKVILELSNEEKLVWFNQLDSLVELVDTVSNIIYDLKKGGAGKSIQIDNNMSEREKDISLIYNTYQKYLITQKLIDKEEVINQAIRIIDERDITLGESLIIYTYELSLLQQQFIEKLERCFNKIKIYFHYDYESDELFKENNKVLSIFKERGYRIKKMYWEKKNISDYLFRNNKSERFDYISVKGYFTKSLEVQNVLRKIKDLIISGVLPTDIAIVSYNLRDYQPLLNFFSKQFQLPLDSVSTSLDKEIFIKKLLLPLNIKRLDFQKDFFLEFLRMPFKWPEFFDRKLIAKFITLSPFDSSISNWQQACYTQQRIKDEEMVFNHDELNSISQSLLYIKKLFNKIPQRGNFPTMISSVLEIFDSIKLEEYISEQLASLNDDDSEKLFSLWQSFNLFIYQENEFNLWPNDMTFNEFFEIFKKSLAKSLSNKEILIDQTIDILNPYQIAGISKKYVFLIGANEGVIPATSISWIRGIEVDELSNLPLGSNHNDLLFQKGLFMRLLDASEEELFISCILENFKGEEYYLSSFVVDILQIANLDIDVDGRIWPDISKVAYESELQQVLANKQAINQLDEFIKQNYEIEKMRSEATASIYNGVIKSDDIVNSLNLKFSDYFTLSTSMLEEYGKCPFAFMMKRVLSLEEVEEFEIE